MLPVVWPFCTGKAPPPLTGRAVDGLLVRGLGVGAAAVEAGVDGGRIRRTGDVRRRDRRAKIRAPPRLQAEVEPCAGALKWVLPQNLLCSPRPGGGGTAPDSTTSKYVF